MTESWIEQELGPFGPAALKPYSRTRFATDGSALLKVYVGIAPEGRRQREVATVERAALQGVSVPAVLATGNGEAGSWTPFRTVGGTPCLVSTHKAMEEYVGHVVAVSGRLHRPTAGATPGSGWGARRASPVSPRRFLLDQFSPRCRRLPWWAVLSEVLQPIDSHPVVHLHGDLKPEHLSSTTRVCTSSTGRRAPADRPSSTTPTLFSTSYATCCTGAYRPDAFRSIS
ncbi:phosphotransferase [Streptomyces sp. NPDC052236]|uniref:phosphotransferase n=1 Tax=Streptomyces sp. NPDC052236 TaxID=3365686 RepID=UPI0037D7FD9D